MLEIDIRVQRAALDLVVQEVLPVEGVTAIFGPSGGGKSTLLRVIAGFEPAVGRICLHDEVWLDDFGAKPPQDRGVGYMFQDARLFTHLNVLGNLKYAERRAPQHSGSLSLGAAVEAFDLSALLSRQVRQLSGGERQRVALARTLLSQPRLLLLDEPLAALDLVRKAEILPYLESLAAENSVPMIYVSHDVDEVARLADRMLVLSEGRVRAFGATSEILERLDLQTLLGRFEGGVLLQAQVTGHDSEFNLTKLALGDQTLTMPEVTNLKLGAQVRLRVRARDVALATQHPIGLSIRNSLRGRIREITSVAGSPFAEVLLIVDDQHLRARITRAAVADLGLVVDQRVYALIKTVTFDRQDA
jgi:molybdate transport system ATP-binding protein